MNIDNGTSILAAVSIFSLLKIKEANIIMNNEIYALKKIVKQIKRYQKLISKILDGYLSIKSIYGCQGLAYVFIKHRNFME